MLNIGQKVRVKANLIVDNFYGGKRFHNGMSRCLGKDGAIMGSPWYDSAVYGISQDKEGYDWTEAMLDIIE
jgi:hypothetical protein